MLPATDLQDNIFYRLILYGYSFMLCNVYFFLFCIPVSLLFLLFHNDVSNILTWVILFVASIPIGPALTASFSVMGKLVREKQVEVTKTFFQSWKLNFTQSALFFSTQCILITILIIDIVFLKQHPVSDYISPLLYLLLILNILVALYLYPLISHFSITNKSALKLSIWCSFTKLKTTILLLALLGLTFLILYYIPKLPLYFLTGPFCFAVMFIVNNLFQEIETMFLKS
ncbi:DUF624 domain-containing protein [Bacillus alveayuensis]|jgi:uncharacterized membrane protein YesL|uniref:DUF624 domain-containing protein n=1 Tax=Aeribacillus alveayuensis TaxID=279215 RepID=UPI0005CDC332|nr:DUF624 domain-containing protein [Bacillus alveayuensis]